MLKQKSLAELAFACNGICIKEIAGTKPSKPDFIEDGEQRLIGLAAYYSQVMELNGDYFNKWQEYRAELANLACEIGSTVFLYAPEKTGATLVFYLLTKTGFHRKQKGDWRNTRKRLEIAIQNEPKDVLDVINDVFIDPDSDISLVAK
jgi:hypothetical protein